MRKILILVGFILFVLSGLLQKSFAAEQIVYGPQQFKIPKAGSLIDSIGFSSVHIGPGAKLRIVNGSNGRKQIESGRIVLNGSEIVSSAELVAGIDQIEKDVSLLANNILNIDISGTFNSYVVVTIYLPDTGSPLPTASLTSNPTTINVGNSSTLTWATTDADTVSIDQGIGPVAANDSTNVSPAVTTTYTITAVGADGTATDSTTVTVDSGEPNSATVFGPQTYQVSKSGSLFDTATFSSVQVGPGGIIRVENGKSNGRDIVDSGSILLNGIEVISGAELNNGTGYIEKDVSLHSVNNLQINLLGAFKSFVIITVITIPYTDVTPPTVDSFTLPGSHNTQDIPISSFSASDDVGVTGYLVTETSTKPDSSNPNWSATPPSYYSVTSDGNKTLYAWAKDASENVSSGASATVTVDSIPPVITLFEAPAFSNSYTIQIDNFTASDNLSIAGYLITETNVAPAVDDPNWSTVKPTTYTAASEGNIVLYAWVKDALDNISQNVPDSVLIDVTKPAVETFIVPPNQQTLDIEITELTATDNFGVESFLVTETGLEPLSDSPDWSSAPPTSFTVSSEGDFTLYAWAKDQVGHVSPSFSTQVNVTFPDTTPPIIVQFELPAEHDALDVPIIAFSASDDKEVAGYLVTESATTPDIEDSNWSATPPLNYIVPSAGSYNLYGWVKDAANNISTSAKAVVDVVLVDPTVPVVNTFIVPSEYGSLTVPILLFEANDDVEVAGYLVTDSATIPSPGDPDWSVAPQAEFVFLTEGLHTLYAWAKDADDKVSTPVSANVLVILPDSTPPTVDTFEVQPVVHVFVIPIADFSASDDVGVTGYLITETATQPSAEDPNWSASPQSTYTVAAEGDYTLYAWAIDANNNVSAALSKPVTIFLLDIIPPTVDSFVIPENSTSLTVQVLDFTASDNVAVTEYLITESAATPTEDNPDWTSTPPSNHLFTTPGDYTLYAWAKDAEQNLSEGVSASVTISLPDNIAPTVTEFVIPATHDSLIVPIEKLTATDDTGVTGYMITETDTQPATEVNAWQATIPSTFGFESVGNKTLYAWAKDGAGNISAGLSTNVDIVLSDTVKPSISSFTVPSNHDSLTIPIMDFVASDNVGVVGYLINEEMVAPLPNESAWRSVAPVSYTASGDGLHTLYAWVKDLAGNVSLSVSSDVNISITTGANSVRYHYDSLKRLTRVIAGSEGRIYSYDEVGNLLSIVNANTAAAPPVLEEIDPGLLFVGGATQIHVSGQNLLTTESVVSNNPDLVIDSFQVTEGGVSIIATTKAPGIAAITVITAFGSANINVTISDSRLTLTPGQLAVLPGDTGIIEVSLQPSLPQPVSMKIQSSRPDVVSTPSIVTIPSGGVGSIPVDGHIEGSSRIKVGPKYSVVFVNVADTGSVQQLATQGVSVYIDSSDVLTNGAVYASTGVSVLIEEAEVIPDGGNAFSRPVSVYIEPWSANTSSMSSPVSVYIDRPTTLVGGSVLQSRPVSVYLEDPETITNGVNSASRPVSVFFVSPDNGSIGTYSRPVSVFFASSDNGSIGTYSRPVSIYVSSQDELAGGATSVSSPLSVYINSSETQISVQNSSNKISVQIENNP